MDTAELIETFEYIIDKIEGYVDIGIHGGPNDAMRALEEAQAALDKLRAIAKKAA